MRLNNPYKPSKLAARAQTDYRLQHRLWGWLGGSAALLLCVSWALSLRHVASAIAPQTAQLSHTIAQLRLNEIAFELGVFQGKISGQELQRLSGLGELVPFCFTVRDIHAQEVGRGCFGMVSAHPLVVEHLVRWAATEAPVSTLPLVRYPGITVGELSITPNWPAHAALLWQQGIQSLLSTGVWVVMALLGFEAARRALRPTRAMMQALQQLEAGDLNARMPRAAPHELQRISSTFNRMATRLQDTITTQRQLADQLLTLQESERRHLARELHDELGQALTSIRAEVAFIEEVAVESEPALLPSVHALTRSCEHMVLSVRHIVQQLRPAGLETFGLTASLHHLVDHWQRRDGERCRYELEIQGDIDDLDDTLTVSVYRLVQEGLTNAIRHGQASLIRIRLAGDARGLHLLIEDDGKLTELPATPLSGGHGLLGMRERVLALGGTLSMDIRPPHGLRLQLDLPLHQPCHELNPVAPADR